MALDKSRVKPRAESKRPVVEGEVQNGLLPRVVQPNRCVSPAAVHFAAGAAGENGQLRLFRNRHLRPLLRLHGGGGGGGGGEHPGDEHQEGRPNRRPPKCLPRRPPQPHLPIPALHRCLECHLQIPPGHPHGAFERATPLRMIGHRGCRGARPASPRLRLHPALKRPHRQRRVPQPTHKIHIRTGRRIRSGPPHPRAQLGHVHPLQRLGRRHPDQMMRRPRLHKLPRRHFHRAFHRPRRRHGHQRHTRHRIPPSHLVFPVTRHQHGPVPHLAPRPKERKSGAAPVATERATPIGIDIIEHPPRQPAR